MVLEELEKRPPNRQLLSPILASFIAGLAQAAGAIGFIKLADSTAIYTPFIRILCDLETVDFLIRQINDGWVVAKGRKAELHVLGMRAVLLFKIIGPYLRGYKREAVELIVLNGYKLNVSQIREVKQAGFQLKTAKIELDGKAMREYTIIGGSNEQRKS